MNQFEQFTGGPLDTNAFLISGPSGNILIDAPMGTVDWLAGRQVEALLLTHGHFDHTADAAAVKAAYGCKVGCHPDTLPMISDREFFRRWGFGYEVEPVGADHLIDEPGPESFCGLEFRVLHVPGHCPGSLCFYLEEDGILFGGDVLFAGGTGRWDLPGGDRELLFGGIRKKLWLLPDATRVFPGHGPETTIGTEKNTGI